MLPDVVHVGIAEVDAERVGAVRRAGSRAKRSATRAKASSQPISRHSLPDAPQRAAQPVRIGVHVEERIALGADVAAAEGIGRVAADGDDRLAFVLDLEAADRLAQGAGAEARAAHQARPFSAGRCSR